MSRSPKAKRPKVLLIEDKMKDRNWLESVLRPLQLRIHSFSYGAEAMGYFKKNQDFDLLITELSLPQVDGKRIVDEIKQAKPNIPIIIVTGKMDKVVFDALNQVSNLEILTKPVPDKLLVNTVTRILDL